MWGGARERVRERVCLMCIREGERDRWIDKDKENAKVCVCVSVRKTHRGTGRVKKGG